MDAPRWDLFCRVIDNHGDAGVCWRLAVDLAARGLHVRLWIDDASALEWMAPDGSPGVDVVPWPAEGLVVEPGDVVVEAFGCELPNSFIAQMASRARPPVWIDLEYLSAEDYVERSHGLASPQAGGPGAGLSKRFFFPGFTARTGGLIREAHLMNERQAFDPKAWLQDRGIVRRPGERLVSLFCYEQPMLPALMNWLATDPDRVPTLLLLTHGQAALQAGRWLASSTHHGLLRAHVLPPLTQTDYDRLLWSCDLNFVRGEDSFVRAQWAGQPFVWQAYPQHDGAHLVKVDAFLQRHLGAADAGTAVRMRELWAGWNGRAPVTSIEFPKSPAWQTLCIGWRDRLLAQSDLVNRLLDFAAGAPPTTG